MPNTAATVAIATSSNWADDLLGHQNVTQFLTPYLAAMIGAVDSESDNRSFTLAIDAGWGRGKTFLVERWARDLREAGPIPFPAVVFNAWSADFASDPLTAFMSELRKSIAKEIAEAGLAPKATKLAKESLRKATNSLRRAAVPTARYIGKAALKKLSGVDLDGLADAVAHGIDLDAAKGGAADTLDGALDKFFEAALKESADRSRLISEFRRSLQDALEAITDTAKRRLPMFVFVDEIDRCRPTFAIELLEDLKHIFGIPGVCFVVSTNLQQLAESVKAVYGAGFSGREYLNRFFDSIFTLPEIHAADYALQLLAERPLPKRDYALGLPDGGFEGIESKDNPADSLTWVASTFNLDPRSLRQVYTMILAVSASAPGEQIPMLWLATLCAVKFRSDSALRQIQRLSGDAAALSSLSNIWSSLAAQDIPRQFKYLDNELREEKVRSVTLLDVIAQYLRWSEVLPKMPQSASDNVYPKSLWRDVHGTVPRHGRAPGVSSPLGKYFPLVFHAGYLIGPMSRKA